MFKSCIAASVQECLSQCTWGEEEMRNAINIATLSTRKRLQSLFREVERVREKKGERKFIWLLVWCFCANRLYCFSFCSFLPSHICLSLQSQLHLLTWPEMLSQLPITRRFNLLPSNAFQTPPAGMRPPSLLLSYPKQECDRRSFCSLLSKARGPGIIV